MRIGLSLSLTELRSRSGGGAGVTEIPLSGRAQWPFGATPSFSSGVQFQTLHNMRATGTGLRLLYLNNSAASITFTASARKGFTGTPETVTASGSPTLTIAAYSRLETDALSFDAEAGEVIYCRAFFSPSGATTYCSGYICSTYNPEGVTYTAAGGLRLVDGYLSGTSRLLEGGSTWETDMCATTTANGTALFGPYAVIGTPTYPVRLSTALGDSKTQQTTQDAVGAGGRIWLGYALGGSIGAPWQDLGVGGDTLANFNTASDGGAILRRSLLAYGGDFINHYGANDVANGANGATQAAAQLAAITALRALLPRGSRLYNSTADPHMGKSSGSWDTITEGQQIQDGNGSKSRECILAYNVALLASGTTYGSGVLDLASAVESTPGSGYWAPAMTADGIHQTDAGNSAQGAYLKPLWPPGGYLTGESLTLHLRATVGTLRNNGGGVDVGIQIVVGEKDIDVTQVGRWVHAGNSGSHALRLTDSGGTPITNGGATVATSGATPGAFKFAALPATVRLAAGGTYYLFSVEPDGGDQWGDSSDTSIVPRPGVATVGGAYYAGGPHGAGGAYGPLSLIFRIV